VTEQEYQAAIPKCCRWRTFQEHWDALGLCWGITHGLIQKQGESYCDTCDENVNNDQENQCNH